MIMKKILILTSVLFFYLSSISQSPETVVGIEVKALEDYHQSSKIKNAFTSRIQQGLTKKGIGSSKYAPFKVVGTISSGGVSYTATAPVRMVHTYFFELQLENSSSGEVFGTYSEEVRSVKRSEQEAVRQAIHQLNFSDTDFQNFIAETKTQIQDYYQSNCKAILANARRAQSQKSYAEAIAHLQSIPTTSECGEESNTQMEETMKAYESFACSQYLTKARALIANRQPGEAAAVLMIIPNTNACSDKINSLIDELQLRKDQIDQQTWDRTMALHQVKTEQEKLRYQFLSNLAYFNSRPDLQVILDRDIIVVD